MRKMYYLWFAGLVLKLVGASWDVAWHFRYIREAFTPPHAINLVGELLVVTALALDLRRPAPHRRVPLLVIVAGFAIFVLAIPFDQWWHVTFGIDVTTWSPAHLLLFSGTAVGLTGIVLMLLADMRHEHPGRGATLVERVALALLLVGLVEALAFPLAYNEYTAVAAPALCSAPVDLSDPISVEAHFVSRNCTDIQAAVFRGTHAWLYPLYSIAAAVLLATLLRAALGPGWAAFAMVGFSVERALANAAIAGTGWPAAVVPLQYVPLGLALEAVWLVPGPTWARAGLGGAAGALAGYAYLAAPPPIDHVPVDWSSAPYGMALAAALALLAVAVASRWPTIEARVPVLEWETYPARVRAWWHAR